MKKQPAQPVELPPQDLSVPSDQELLRQLEQSYAADPRYNMSQSELLAQIQNQPSSDLIRWWHDNTDVIDQLWRDLTDASWDTHQNRFVPNEKTRLINDEGVKNLQLIVRSHTSKGVKLSNLEEEDIKRIHANCMMEVVMLLWAKHSTFKIDKNNLGVIRTIIDTLVYTELRRAFKAGEKRFLRGTITYDQSVQNNSNNATHGDRKRMLGLF